MNKSVVPIRKRSRCRHYHLSGRRCGMTTSNENQLCNTHQVEDLCTECITMKATFVPPKGW